MLGAQSQTSLLSTLDALKRQGALYQRSVSADEEGDRSEKGSAIRLFPVTCVPSAQKRSASLRFAIATLLGLIAALVFHPVFLMVGVLVYFIERTKLEGLARKKSQDFEQDYTAFLITLSSSVKAGRDPLSALIDSEGMFSKESEVAKQIKALRHAMDREASEDAAIFNFARSIDNPDVSLFRLAFLLARKEGSALSLCLERLARVTRHRQAFRRKVKGAVALQRLSSIGIAGIAIFALLFQLVTNLENFKVAMNHPIGMAGLSIGGLLMVVGLFWMTKIAPGRY